MRLPQWVEVTILSPLFARLVIALLLTWATSTASADGAKDRVENCSANCSTSDRCAKFLLIPCGKHITCRERNHCVAVCQQHCQPMRGTAP